MIFTPSSSLLSILYQQNSLRTWNIHLFFRRTQCCSPAQNPAASDQNISQKESKTQKKQTDLPALPGRGCWARWALWNAWSSHSAGCRHSGWGQTQRAGTPHRPVPRSPQRWHLDEENTWRQRVSSEAAGQSNGCITGSIRKRTKACRFQNCIISILITIGSSGNIPIALMVKLDPKQTAESPITFIHVWNWFRKIHVFGRRPVPVGGTIFWRFCLDQQDQYLICTVLSFQWNLDLDCWFRHARLSYNKLNLWQTCVILDCTITNPISGLWDWRISGLSGNSTAVVGVLWRDRRRCTKSLMSYCPTEQSAWSPWTFTENGDNLDTLSAQMRRNWI